MGERTDVLNLKRRRMMDLKDFFSAAEARIDRWCEMNTVGRAWEAAGAPGQPGDKLHAQAAQLLGEISPMENYWAYPGSRLMATVRETLDEANAAVFARLVQKISNALLTGGYRHDSAAWDPLQEGEARPVDVLPPDAQTGDTRKPYFEILVLTPNDPSTWERARNELKRLRRPEDLFHYEIVQVGSFEDAAIGTIFNHNIQAVVIYDGFQFRSHHELPMMRDFLVRNLNVDPTAIAPGALATTLARMVKNYRPELDIYLLTDRSIEKIAGSEAGAPIRRIFHNVEEIMEVHLSVLDGVNERYDTPFFFNLKRYAQRPIGTFHALPVARGKSIFRSNWIRDMGQFYGTNIFLAESSATSGGLDSLLEPTGNIKKAHEAAARAFGAKRAYFGINGTSTSNKIVVQAVCKPGDIVIVDRNCHKSHHYGFVLTGAQPYYVEAYPLTEYSMYGAVPLRTIKKALLDCKAEGTLDRVRAVDMTNCTFDGHMYNPARVMEECLAIKPDMVFLWDEAWYAYNRFSPFHRMRSAMGACETLREKYASEAYRAQYDEFKKKHGKIDPKNEKQLLNTHLLPDPDAVKLRVYATTSTHKSLSCFRQGSYIMVNDDCWESTEASFKE